MRKFSSFLAIALASSMAIADTSVQVRAGSDGFEFGFLYSDYYHVDAPAVKERHSWISEPDLVVALHLCRASGVELNVVLDWRHGGATWDDITRRCKLDSNVYYVEVPDDAGPPYGRAWGHWKKKNKQRIDLSDSEIRALVELRVVSDYSGISPGEVLRHKKDGMSASSIAQKGKGQSKNGNPAATRSKGNGKGKKG